MSDNQLNDLKQYFTSTLFQATAEMTTKSDLTLVKTVLSDLIINIEIRLDDIQGHIAESLSVANDSVDEQIKAHNSRITKLELAIS